MKEENQHNSAEQANVAKMLSETIESKQREKIDDDYSTSIACLSLFFLFLSVLIFPIHPYTGIALLFIAFLMTFIPYFRKNSRPNGCLFAVQILLILLLLFILFVIRLIAGACCGGMSM